MSTPRPYSITTLENGAWLLLKQLYDNGPTTLNQNLPIPEINMWAVFNYFSSSAVASAMGNASLDQKINSLLSSLFVCEGSAIQASSVRSIVSGLDLVENYTATDFFKFASDFYTYSNAVPDNACPPSYYQNCPANTQQECALWCLQAYLIPDASYSPQCFMNNCNSTTSGTAGNYIVSILEALNMLTINMQMTKTSNILNLVSTGIANFIDLLKYGTDYSDGYLLALNIYLNVYLKYSCGPNCSLYTMSSEITQDDLSKALISPSADGTTVTGVTPLFISLYKILWQIYCEMFSDSSVAQSSLVDVSPCGSTYVCPCGTISNCTLTNGISQYYGTCVAPTPPGCTSPNTVCACKFPSGATPLDGPGNCCPTGTTCAAGSSDPNYGAVCACCGGAVHNPGAPISCGGVCMPASQCNSLTSPTKCCYMSNWNSSTGSCGASDQFTC